jgi:hypothetical protein
MWTIAELAGEATAALAGDRPAVNGRVRDLPNERLIRWYTTIGLVDPPLARRGRTALYGRRHLLQLVAVKRLQAAGRSIAEIQAELTGAPDISLESTARLPAPASPPDTTLESTARSPAAPPEAPPARFWTRPPTPDTLGNRTAPEPGTADTLGNRTAPEPGTGAATRPAPSHNSHKETAAAAHAASGDPTASLTLSSGDAAETAAEPPAGAGRPGANGAAGVVAVVGVRLAPGVTLLVDGVAALGPAELAALADAARPLLDELARHTPPGRSP